MKQRDGFNMTKEELEARVTKLESILEIHNLQAKYGYYHQRGGSANWDECLDLFTDDCTVEIGDGGVYVGRAGITKMFELVKTRLRRPGGMAIVMQLQPYIQVYGDVASGVWQGFGFFVNPKTEAVMSRSDEEKIASWIHGRYENEYRRVDGKWKFSKIHFKFVFQTPYGVENGWVERPVGKTVRHELIAQSKPLTGYADRPSTEYRPYNPLAKTPEEAMPDPILPPVA
jgi:hypothetical protein